MSNILLASDSKYYTTWGINCLRSIRKFVPWLNVHMVIVNPDERYEKVNGVNYYEDNVNFPNENCKVAYYQAIRFVKCSELFGDKNLVMSIDCDTVLTRSFTKDEFTNVCKNIHVQRHQKADRWMAGLVTYGDTNEFRNELRRRLLTLPLENWDYGWDQTVLNQLAVEFKFIPLPVGNWMSFGKGKGTFLTLKGSQKLKDKFLKNYNNYVS